MPDRIDNGAFCATRSIDTLGYTATRRDSRTTQIANTAPSTDRAE